MITKTAYFAVGHMMAIAGFTKMWPYRWNSKTFRIEKPFRWQSGMFYLIAGLSFSSACFMAVRLLQTKDVDIPPRIRVLHITWLLAYSMISICKLQLHLSRNKIMGFVNALLEHIELERDTRAAALLDGSTQKHVTGIDWISPTVVMATALVYMNPFTHAFMLLSTPCATHFFASLIFDCKDAEDNPNSLLEKLPYFIWELFIMSDVLGTAAVISTTIILVLTWTNEELKQCEEKFRIWESRDFREVLHYRHCQLIKIYLNDTFNLYLQWIPAMLYVMAGILYFATIRFADADISLLAYSNFPACSFRCLVETTSILEAAGRMNLASKSYLEYFATQIQSQNCENKKFLQRLQKSCWILQCSAGSFYTFEKSIVLVSLDNCSQLTFSILVAYPRPEQ